MKTIVFDLDGTLTESKKDLDEEMATLLEKLLAIHNVAIISGASWKQFESQVLSKITKNSDLLNKLYLLPTSGASLFQVWGKYGWIGIYQLKLNRKDISKITKAIEESVVEVGWEQPKKIWGKQIENRESQVTFSALGQDAPIEEKKKFDPDFSKRKVLLASLQKRLPNFDVRMGGSTSIDISMEGVNKKYGIDELMQRLHVSKDDVIYVGDAIFKGGNDYVAIEMGLEYVQVQNPDETKQWIRQILEANSLDETA